MNNTSKAGITLAIAAAGLFLAGCTTTPNSPVANSGSVHCLGVNACKGHGACKTASNTCKGQNACKGQGFEEKSTSDCKAAGGTIASN